MTCEHYPKGGNILCRECDLIAIENHKALVRDAARYRKMRANAAFQYRNGPGLYWYLPRWNRDLPVGERLDAALDAK